MKSPHGLYTFHRFAQRTEWLAWTKTGLMAEDAPTILGENPWKTPAELLREKSQGEETPKTEAMQTALLHRPQILEAYQKTSGEELQKANIQSKERPWQRAGLDGISKNRWHIVELKAGEYAYKKALELQRVPAFYYAEGQHILAITGLPYMTFHFHTGKKEDKPLSLQLRRNPKYIERLLEKETAFFQLLKTQKLNPSKALLQQVQNAIRKIGPKVDFPTYQSVVPSFVTPLGELTKEGQALLAETTKQ